MLVATLAGGLAIPLGARAQDVELLGYIHGTRPPAAYYEQMRRDPDSFRFRVEGADRMRSVREGMRARAGNLGFRPDAFGGAGAPGAGSGAPASTLGPPGGPVAGVFSFPLVLGLFSDGTTTPAFTALAIQTEFFDGPNSYGMTLPEFYDEVSGGMVELLGTTFPWTQSGMTRAQVTLGKSGLSPSYSQGVGAFIEAIVTALDQSGVDWGPFDGDGDGYVDVLTVLHPTAGAECNNATDRIWSHRWNLAEATQQRLAKTTTHNPRDGVRTSTASPAGDNLYVNDYTIQPLLACDGQDINEIGTFAHEMGHAFGLPDLYRTYSSAFYAGAGNWDLMGTGGWGCQGNRPQRPCHMGAWSKAILGWVDVQEVAPDFDEVVTLEPVETSQRVLKLPARDASPEYVLIENRERIGSDDALYEPGLLVWHIDESVLASTWAFNTVNSDASRPGVWLRQADGRNDLFSTIGGRGDPGDSFPGCIKPSPADYGNPDVECTRNLAFHAGTVPAAVSHMGSGLGTTLLDIELVGAEPHDVQFRLNTQILTMRVEAEQQGAPANVPGFVLDGATRSSPFQFLSAPFQTHELTAAGGIPTAPGKRISFLEWADGGPRTREITTQFSNETFLARYQDEEIRLTVSANEPVEGVPAATFTADPDGVAPEGDDFWFPQGTVVSVLAEPRTGFAFRDWVGVADAAANPTVLTLDSPTAIQANFDLVYALAPIPPAVQAEAAIPQQIALEVSDGNDPVTWIVESGALPPGLALGSTTGVITGIPTDVGHYQAGILARDAIGLEARGALDIEVVPPSVGVQLLVSSFLGSSDLLTPAQGQFFDRVGNANGSYDIGDFRAYLMVNPDLPETAPAPLPSRTTVPIGAFGAGARTQGAESQDAGEGRD